MYRLEEMAHALKQARQAKALSQRALSAKTGLTQKHISKIENAEVDLRLSNLLELARALDLEVMLVPRNAVPAAQSLVRTVEANARPPADPNTFIRRLVQTVGQIQTLAPNLKEVHRLASVANNFKNLRLTRGQLQVVHNATRELQRIRLPKPPHMAAWHDEARRLAMVTKQLQQVRNAIAHAPQTPNQDTAKPAYQLDEDGDTDG